MSNKNKKKQVLKSELVTIEQDKNESKKDFLGYVKTSNGKFGIVKNMELTYESRILTFSKLEDNSVFVIINRTDRGEDNVAQELWLTEVTLALFIFGIYDAIKHFDIDIDSILESLSKKQ